MAFTYINSATYDSSGSPRDMTCPVPTGLTSGDILFCLRSHFSYSANTWTTGWSRLAQNTDSGSHWWELFYRLYDGIVTGITTSVNGSGRRAKMTIVGYSGGDFYSNSPILTLSNVKYSTLNTRLLADSITTEETNTIILLIGGIYSSTVRTFSKPTGLTNTNVWIEDYDEGTANSDMQHNFNHIVWSGFGETGAQWSTISASIGVKHAFLIALNKIPAPPPPRHRIRITHM